MYYVTMTDKFLSGWGKSEGKINKLVFECETYMEAEIVEKNANNRDDMKYVNIVRNRPSYPSSTHFTQHKTKEDSSNWYRPNSFN